jgi:hypothetical protein
MTTLAAGFFFILLSVQGLSNCRTEFVTENGKRNSLVRTLVCGSWLSRVSIPGSLERRSKGLSE